MRTLKHLFLFTPALWIAAAAFLQAEPSGLINYQGRLLDKYGRRVNAPVEIVFKIYQGAGAAAWSEKHESVPVTDGLYSVVLGSLTPLTASLFSGEDAYLEICINGEPLRPRQRITASPYALSARTIHGPEVYVDSQGNLGIGTTNPVEKLDVRGVVQATGFKMPTGAAAGYALVSDASGSGSWQALSQVNSSDSITNWTDRVFAPATNDLWTAVRTSVAYADYSVATGALWTAVGRSVLLADYSTATNQLWDAVRARLQLSGGAMSGPLTNNAGFFGDGAGLTNISAAAVSLTNYVLKTGDAMTGALIVSNNLSVAGGTIWQPGSRTISTNDSVTLPADQTYLQIGTTDGVLKRLGSPQIASGSTGQLLMIQCLNNAVILTNSQTLVLTEGVSFFMSTNDIIQLVYDGAKWVEMRRADNN